MGIHLIEGYRLPSHNFQKFHGEDITVLAVGATDALEAFKPKATTLGYTIIDSDTDITEFATVTDTRLKGLPKTMKLLSGK